MIGCYLVEKNAANPFAVFEKKYMVRKKSNEKSDTRVLCFNCYNKI